MQQVIETHLPDLTQSQLTGLLVGLRDHPGRERLPECRRVRPLHPGQLEQPAPVSPGVVVRRRRPGASLQDRTGREPLLRAAAEMGPGLVEFRPAGPGGGPHVERGRNHCHRHQRGLPDAIPVAWRIRRATQRGSWMDPIVELLRDLAPAVPREMTVVVLCDRGLASPKLWKQIRDQGWHPYMRYPKSITFCAQGGRRLPARAFVPRPDTAWIGQGTAFGTAAAKRRCTLLVVWYAGQEEPWVILTDLPPGRAQLVRPALLDRTGLQALKSLGWKSRPGERTRRASPATGSCSRWPRCSLGLWWVDDAHDRRVAPGILRTAQGAVGQHRGSWQKPRRRVSVIRHGIDWLRRLLLQGRLWSRVWLLPEPWPQPKPNLEVTHHAPA